jgi:hypothetical protein
VQGLHRLVERYNLSTKGRVEGLLLPEVHRVEEIKHLEVFGIFPQGVRAGVLSRLKVAKESLGWLTFS